ncbi:MAG TPA: hypothetical protein VGX68_19215 [Thermoanaerobaculia bacterium]|nr:hypothetical protein [Thermoanaerobaculia bacterium]
MTALLAASVLPILLGLLGSRLSPLAAPGDGALYRATLYVLGGAVVLHLVLTLLDFAGVPWSLALLAALGAALFLGAWRLLPRNPQRSRLPSDLGWGDGLAFFVLVAFTLVALTGWIAIPDFIYHWGLKGHRYDLGRGVDYAFLGRSWNFLLHPDYPNLAPELFAVTAMLAGGFEVPAMMLGTGVFFALLLAAAREGLRQGGADRFTRQAGLAVVALSAGAFGMGHRMAGAADWMMALALAAVLPPLLRPPDRAGDWQIGIAAAFAAAAKEEGVPLAAILVSVQLGRRVWAERRLAPAAAARTALPAAAVILPWLGRTVHHHLFQPFNSGPFRLARAGEILAAVMEAMSTRAWHGFAAAALLPPLLLLLRRTRAFAAVATLQLLFYVYVYFTIRLDDLRFFILANFARLAFHLVPASLVAALLAWPSPSRPSPAAPTAAGLQRQP